MKTRGFGVFSIGVFIALSVRTFGGIGALASEGTRVLAATEGNSSVGKSGAGVLVKRPSYSKGNGWFVLDGKLYDPKGSEVRIRGVNRVHWDSSSGDGIARSGSNTVRWNIDFSRPARSNLDLIRTESIQHGQIPIIGNWSATCKSNTAALEAAVSTWVSQAPEWTKLNMSIIVNVANEWGPAGSTDWRDAYIAAIRSLRAAGYTAPILVDSGGCGQDDADLLEYSRAVFNSDPERNVMFALHMYGNSNDFTASIKSITKGVRTVVTLDSNSATHPFAPKFNGANNNFSGIAEYQISGVKGMNLGLPNGVAPALRNVGGIPGAWTVTLAVDSTGWINYAGGGILVDYNGNYALKIARLAALAEQTGAVYIIGEFGPGRNIGPSPTTVTPAEVISAAEANRVGWLAWAWDDNNGANCSSDDNWFDMTYHCGIYEHPSDLTKFGQDVVLNPVYGLKSLAKRATPTRQK